MHASMPACMHVVIHEDLHEMDSQFREQDSRAGESVIGLVQDSRAGESVIGLVQDSSRGNA
jgi:hypothetical protein